MKATSDTRITVLYPTNIYKQKDYLQTLDDLEFGKGCKRVRFERLKIPSSGEIAIKVIHEVEDKEVENITIEILFTIEKTILELKANICEHLQKDPKLHKLYKTDWLETPIQAFKKEHLPLERHGFKDNEIIVIRATSFPIKAELLTFEIYLNVDRATNLEVSLITEITLTT